MEDHLTGEADRFEEAMRNRPSYREELNAKLRANRERAALKRAVLLFIASLITFVLLLWLMGTAFCAELSPSTCKVVEFDVNGKLLGYGSGVLVEKSDGIGRVLTAEHVIGHRNPSQFIVVFPRSKYRTIHRVLNWHKEPFYGETPPASGEWEQVDLCLLEIDAPQDILPRPIAWRMPEVGEKVWQSGFGNSNQPPAEYWSRVKPPAKAKFTHKSLLLVDRHTRHGDSGGPVIDADGRVIGITSSGDGTINIDGRWMKDTDGYHVTLADQDWLRELIPGQKHSIVVNR